MSKKFAHYGEVWICKEGIKKRPVLIISEGIGVDVDISLARITTRKPTTEWDVQITRWEDAGLNEISYVRCAKVNTFERHKLDYKIGKLCEEDLQIVKSKIIEYFTKSMN